ncbi:uncharacterized protein LOC117116277 [Anneissia japonica]|uniref:uncharacterized protein LOC117116277 n=1 Tax=Anneissia japonica TaxID=1529436 RepID=UPI0014255649|nr:uncharacterized protein LOC117116277 [Anneissia japonica]
MANGLVERFHRHLKASLNAYNDPTKWTEHLPIVLLGIRTALKEDLGHCAAELVYGTTLRLSGQFFDKHSELTEYSNYVHRLRDIMSNFYPTPTRTNPNRKSYISQDLLTCTHVFVRRDSVRKPLHHPYDGPFKVLRRADKHFVLDINGRRDTVRIDRLKVAHLDTVTANTPTSTLGPNNSPQLTAHAQVDPSTYTSQNYTIR